MGRDHKKTNFAQSGRSADESEIEERQSALGDQEVGDEYNSGAEAGGEPIDGTQEAATAAASGENAPSWGFEEKKRRFSKEVLIAFVAICVLVGLFSIIVWKQFKKPGKTPDSASIAGKSKSEEPQTNDPFDDRNKPAEPVVQAEPTDLFAQQEPMPASDLGNSEPAQPEMSADLFGNQATASPSSTDLFANNAAPPRGLLDREPIKSTNESVFQSAEPEPMTPVDAQPMARMRTDIAMNTTEDSSLDVGTTTEPSQGLFNDPLVARQRREPSIDTNRFSVDEPIESRSPRPTIDQFDEPRRAPVTTRIEEPRTLDPMPIDEFYVVKEGDTFWDISKKLYGTHGLFLALYEYNRAEYPKADLLRPGQKLRTPDSNVLKVLAAKVTDQGMPDRPVGRVVAAGGSAAVTSAITSREPLSPGVFETEKGLKVYRVGEGDTLRKIAQFHLGRAERWMQIYEMNRNRLKNEHDLQIGAELRLPADASIEPLVTPIASGR